MPAALDQLRADHRNMRQLLEVVEEELAQYRNGGIPDFDVLTGIVDYILNYPTLMHHPAEDLVFRRLIALDPMARFELSELLAQHAELEAATRLVAASIRNVAANAEIPRPWFENQANYCIGNQREHMDREDREFFDRAEETLRSPDWAEVERLMATTPDPLFGAKLRNEYLDLHNRLTRPRP